MSNEIPANVQPAITTSVEAPAPVAATPAVVPTIAPTVSPSVTEAPAVSPELSVTDGTAPVVVETLLGEAKTEVKPTEEVKPPVAEENKPVAETTAEEKTVEGQSDEPAPPPVYDPFELPEGFTPDGDQIKKFTDILSELEVTTKADHAALQAFGQKAVDLYTQEVKAAVDNLQSHYQTAWENTKNEWKESFLKDPEIGGNRFQTTVDSALSFIRTHGGTEEQQAEFRNLMNTSGIGNHPAMIRLLAKAGVAMSEGVPLAASRPQSPAKSKTATLYGKS